MKTPSLLLPICAVIAMSVTSSHASKPDRETPPVTPPVAPPVTPPGKPPVTPPGKPPIPPGQPPKTTPVDFKGKNNGWGNGDQDPPGNSGDNNNAENSDRDPPPGIAKKNPVTEPEPTTDKVVARRVK
jgi:hypothetical protein